MWRLNQNHIENEKLDHFSDELLRALEVSDAEVANAASSPFLFRRIRVRIEAEQRRMVEERSQWLTFTLQIRKAIPVFALLTVFALGSLYLLPESRPQPEQQQAAIGGELPFSQDEIVASVSGWEADRAEMRKEQR